MLGLPPYYELYQLDEGTGLYKKIGKNICTSESGTSEDGPEYHFLTDEISTWPSVEGQLLDIETSDRTRSFLINYEIPVQMGNASRFLRMTKVQEEEIRKLQAFEETIPDPDLELASAQGNTYSVHSLWTGYDEETGMPGRDSRLLVQAAGQEYQLCYPVYSEESGGRKEYLYGTTLTMTRNLDVEEIPLPAGSYMIRFTLTDIFGRESGLPAARFTWDGSQAVLEENSIFNMIF